MLRKRAWSSSSSSQAKRDDCEEEEEEKPPASRVEVAKMESLTSSMSALRFVPRSVKFGKGRPGFAKY
jgi:hypothetical protein